MPYIPFQVELFDLFLVISGHNSPTLNIEKTNWIQNLLFKLI